MISSKIITLIPAYKSEFFQKTMESIINQRIKPKRIIISDDSYERKFIGALSNQLREMQIKSGIRIDVILGPQMGGHANMKHLLKQMDGDEELVHFLLDDDVIFPGFYENHAYFHGVIPSARATISKRTYINASDRQIKGFGCPEFIEKNTARIIALDAIKLYPTVVPAITNWLGEFSNAVFKADCISKVIDFKFSGVSYYGLGDIGAFLEISEINKSLIFINDNLGAFRIHDNSNTGNKNSHANQASVIAWVAIALHALDMKYINKINFDECCRRVKYVLESRNIQCAKDLVKIIEGLTFNDKKDAQNFLNYWENFLSQT
jgi:hypothetical protein